MRLLPRLLDTRRRASGLLDARLFDARLLGSRLLDSRLRLLATLFVPRLFDARLFDARLFVPLPLDLRTFNLLTLRARARFLLALNLVA